MVSSVLYEKLRQSLNTKQQIFSSNRQVDFPFIQLKQGSSVLRLMYFFYSFSIKLILYMRGNRVGVSDKEELKEVC